MHQENQYTSSTVYWTPEGRPKALELLKSGKTWDLVVVGGGITGAGIYREAVAQGLSVLLVEQKDFAWGTSSRSSKMVHGGLRYLGSGQFGLANDSVKERQNLMDELPGLVDPLPFMMAHYKGVFPGPWIFNKLLAIYDYMAGKRYRRFFNKGILDFLVPGLKTERLKGVTQFADAVTDDARLVLRVLQEGNREGGLALNYIRAEALRKGDADAKEGTLSSSSEKVSGVLLKDEVSGETISVSAKVVVNATGVWTDELRQQLGADKVIRPLRGSHLVVPQWRLPVSYSVSFFHPLDKRPVFAFPWEGVTVIGTTDLDHKVGLSNESSISQDEAEYLLDAANQQFPDAKLVEKDVLATWSGVRPVVSKALASASTKDKRKQAATTQKLDLSTPAKPSDENREHVVWDDGGLISVAGGKLTTYRLIALDVLKQASKYLGLTEQVFGCSTHFKNDEKKLDKPMSMSSQSNRRLSGRYGEYASHITHLIEQRPELAKKLKNTDTLLAELLYACEAEGVVHLDDLMLRRTRLGVLCANGASDILELVKMTCAPSLGWSEEKWNQELARYLEIIATSYSLPLTQNSVGKSEKNKGAA